MPRTRVLYASQALFVGPSPATGVENTQANTLQIHRVQSASWDFALQRRDVNQFGQLGAIDRVILESPTVNLNFSYIATNIANESGLGFVTDGSVSAITNLLNETQDEKNYYLQTAPYGDDAAGWTGAANTSEVIGIGNGFLSSYSFEAAVGNFPTVSVKVEGLNVNGYGSTSGQLVPAVNPSNGQQWQGNNFNLPPAVSGQAGQVSALRPGDITISLQALPVGVDINDIKIQRCSLGFDLQREPQNKLGSKFAFSRLIRFPVTVTASIEATVGDLVTGSLSSLVCNDTNFDLGISIQQPTCLGNGIVALSYQLLGAKVDSHNANTTIGPNESVTINYSAQIGSPQQTTIGLFISGSQV